MYENLNIPTVKEKLIKDTKDTSGIYLILNKTTGSYYIGSASTNKFKVRFANHLFFW